MKNNRAVSLISTFLSFIFIIGSFPLTELRADISTHSEYDCYPLLVTYDQTASWDNSTQAEFSITNNSDETVEGWTFKIVYSNEISVTSLWNGLDQSDWVTYLMTNLDITDFHGTMEILQFQII